MLEAAMRWSWAGAGPAFVRGCALMIGLIRGLDRLNLRQNASLDRHRAVVYRCGIWGERGFAGDFIYRLMKCLQPLALLGCGGVLGAFSDLWEAPKRAEFLFLISLLN